MGCYIYGKLDFLRKNFVCDCGYVSSFKEIKFNYGDLIEQGWLYITCPYCKLKYKYYVEDLLAEIKHAYTSRLFSDLFNKYLD